MVVKIRWQCVICLVYEEKKKSHTKYFKAIRNSQIDNNIFWNTNSKARGLSNVKRVTKDIWIIFDTLFDVPIKHSKRVRVFNISYVDRTLTLIFFLFSEWKVTQLVKCSKKEKLFVKRLHCYWYNINFINWLKIF